MSKRDRQRGTVGAPAPAVSAAPEPSLDADEVDTDLESIDAPADADGANVDESADALDALDIERTTLAGEDEHEPDADTVDVAYAENDLTIGIGDQLVRIRLGEEVPAHLVPLVHSSCRFERR